MGKDKNVRLVQRVYEAIGRGDIQAVLDNMAEDVEVRLPGPLEIPFAGTYWGHEGVGRFFQAIGSSADIERFEPREFISQDDQVVVLGHEQLTARSTGRSWDTDWAMVWTIDDGKVRRLREFHETGAISAAFNADAGGAR